MNPSETEVLKMFREKYVGAENDYPIVRMDKKYAEDFLLTQLRLARAEESDKMARAIEMSKQGWIEEGRADERKQAYEHSSLLSQTIQEWQERADKTDFDDEGGTKYDEVALKELVDEARTLLLRCSKSL